MGRARLLGVLHKDLGLSLKPILPFLPICGAAYNWLQLPVLPF